MQRPRIRTLLIDDCKITCSAFGIFLRKDPEIELVGTAFGGEEGIVKAKQLRPDVIVTDLAMPDCDGVAVVQAVMRELPTPIILLSSLEKEHPKIFEALNAGAFDFLGKDQVTASRHRHSPLLNTLIKAANEVALKRVDDWNVKKNINEHSFDPHLRYEVIAIGASTGGPAAIEALLNALPANLSIPVVVAQHMPEYFLLAFAERLNKISPLRVKVAERGEALRGGTIYIVPGHTNTQVIRGANSAQPVFKFTRRQYQAFNHPSIDGLFISLAEVYGSKAIGVILTGMGRDGTEGLRTIRQQQGYTIAQDEASSVVFGMPKSASDSGVVQQMLALREIPGFLVSCLS